MSLRDASWALQAALPRAAEIWRRLTLQAGRPVSFAVVFVLCSSIFVPIAAGLVPPFQNPDETAHFQRVDQIAHGGIVAVRFAGGTSSGGLVDTGIGEVERIMAGIAFHPARKVTAAMLKQADAVRMGTRGMTFFFNTALYPPFLYGPATTGLWIAALAHCSIVHSLFVMRVVNGFACIAVGGAALWLAGGMAPWLFILLSLPMAQALFAAVSQDGLMLVLSALAASLMARQGGHRAAVPRAALWLLCAILCCVIMARPPYLPLAILPAVLPGLTRRSRILCVAATVTPVGIWMGLVAVFTMINLSAYTGISPMAQAWFLSTHPAAWGAIARNTIGDPAHGFLLYAREFIGILGWLDVLLPVLFYPIAGVVLAAALATSRPTVPGGLDRAARTCAGGAILACFVAIFLTQYLTWTPVGSLAVAGVQGRYFLPLAAFLPLLRKSGNCMSRWPLPHAALTAFPAAVVSVVIPVLVYRYYI